MTAMEGLVVLIQACHTTLFKKSDSFFLEILEKCVILLFFYSFFHITLLFTLFSAHKSLSKKVKQ